MYSTSAEAKKQQPGNCCSLFDMQSSNEICILNTKKVNVNRICESVHLINENWWNDYYSFIISESIIPAFAVEICITVSSSWMQHMKLIKISFCISYLSISLLKMMQMEQTNEMHM